MSQSGIILLGLGPGDPKLLTREAWTVIQNAPEIYLRTKLHPIVESLPANIVIHSFDDLYEEIDSYEKVYEKIVSEILRLGQRTDGVIYAVPGHPFIAEFTCPEILIQAQKMQIPVRICEGISFIEPVFSVLGLNPFPHISLVDALTMIDSHHPPFPPDAHAVIAQIYDSYIAAEVKLTLMNLYPDEHTVKLVHSAGTSDVIVEEVHLHEIDQSSNLGSLTVLYLPPIDGRASFESLQGIAAQLRAPDGCPWDREQTMLSLRPHLLEEAYELLDAIDKEDLHVIQEELGDLFLVLIMLTQINSEGGIFSSADVFRGISRKLIYRHPHVYGDLQIDGTEAVLKNWEALKAEERKANGIGKKNSLEGVPITLPALTQAQEYQDRASRVGFDWSKIEGVIDKINEEIVEINEAESADAQNAELGDLFFALVNFSRWLKIDAESALREANVRFKDRFTYVENICRQQGREMTEMSGKELDKLWEDAKKGSNRNN